MENAQNDKTKPSIGDQLHQVGGFLKDHSAGLRRHFYFIFVMALVLGIGVCVYFVTLAFSISNVDYRAEKTRELSSSFRITQDKETVDKVLTLQTANAGPIQPDYDPSRDNPFYE